MKNITFLIAVYNEEDALPGLVEAYSDLWRKYDAGVLFVNDGSRDGTLTMVKSICDKNEKFGYLNLSRNYGKEQAIAAGLSAIPEGQNLILIDGDGQHTPDAVSKLITALDEDAEADMAFGVRETRAYQGALDRFFSVAFYKTVNKMMRHNIDNRLGDFFVARAEIVPVLKQFTDSKLFWKGVYSWVGFTRAIVPIEIKDRDAGTSKFSFFKKMALAIDGIVWLTKFPLHLISIIGLLISLASFLFAIFFVIQWVFLGVKVPGFYTIMTFQSLLGGMTLLSIGVMAQYLSVIFENTSSKPGFITSHRSKLPKWETPSD